jgi:hypothetical protein
MSEPPMTFRSSRRRLRRLARKAGVPPAVLLRALDPNRDSMVGMVRRQVVEAEHRERVQERRRAWEAGGGGAVSPPEPPAQPNPAVIANIRPPDAMRVEIEKMVRNGASARDLLGRFPLPRQSMLSIHAQVSEEIAREALEAERSPKT